MMTQSANTYEDISCQELVELVTDYLDGRMPAELHARFERHIESCTGCRTYLAQMRAAIRATGELIPEMLSPEAERALLAAFRGWHRSAG
jgi:anti-sigma factor RsiW